ncbi:MAG: tRNA-dihydrouridine synthase [Halolamina sp.]
MFTPRLALASLSGDADAAWAEFGATWAGAAFLGGICLDDPTREAAREMVADRDRTEFLPPDPIAFIDEQLSALDGVAIRTGFNVRSTTVEPVRDAAAVAADHGAMLEINAHCRQDELRAAGCGETLLRTPDRLAELVAAASDTGADVSVKVRAELANVDLVSVSQRVEAAGADAVHVDAMDSEPVVADLVCDTGLFVIANNGVRDRDTTQEYLDYGADAVSVGRPSDDAEVLSRVNTAVTEWFDDGEAVGGRAGVTEP